MAIWQFKLDFYPLKGILDELGNIPEQLPSELLFEQANSEDEDPRIRFWMNYNRDSFEELITELTNQLPKVEWLKNSSNTFSWGHEDTNDLTLSFAENDKVESFSCRIDMRTLDEQFIERIIELCITNNFLIADGTGNLRTPNRLELGKLMANTNPANFVADPEKFLNDFERGKRQPE